MSQNIEQGGFSEGNDQRLNKGLFNVTDPLPDGPMIAIVSPA